MGDMESARVVQQKSVSQKYPWITQEMIREARDIWRKLPTNDNMIAACEYILDQQPKQKQRFTLEQIKKAITEEFRFYQISMPDAFLSDIEFRLALQPKTPADRVTVQRGAGGNFSVYMIDGKIVPDNQVVAALIDILREEADSE